MDKISEQNRIPLRDRDFFQRFLMEKMNIKHNDTQAQLEWIKKYLQTVSNIIDDSDRDNGVIRSLIENGNYEDAAKLVIRAIEEESNKIILNKNS